MAKTARGKRVPAARARARSGQSSRTGAQRGKAAARRPTKARKPTVPLPKPRKGRKLPPGMIRLDYDRARGYLVRIGYLRTKSGWRPKFKAYFSDTRWGGKAPARRAAEAWLRTLIRTGRPPRIEAA